MSSLSACCYEHFKILVCHAPAGTTHRREYHLDVLPERVVVVVVAVQSHLIHSSGSTVSPIVAIV